MHELATYTGNVRVRRELDLGQSRDAWPNRQTVFIFGNERLQLVDKFGSLGPRTHQTHFAPEHVPKLKELVDVRGPQESADGRNAHVIDRVPLGAGMLLTMVSHRSM